MPIRSTRLGAGKLTITASSGGLNHEFNSQVVKVELVPSVKKGDAKEVLSGEKIAGDRTETFALKGKIIDDFGTAGSSVEFCFTNRGKEASFDFVPNNANAKKWTGTLTVEAVSSGGDVGAENEVDFEFEVLDVAIGTVA